MMNQVYPPLKRTIAGAVVAAALTIVGTPAPAQDASASTDTAASKPTCTTSTSTALAKPKPVTEATPQMIQEACQRTRARIAKFRECGIPEEFGSEEPFKFDSNAPPC
jgi:ABC-type phosphate transport system substrate-binding protein